MIYAVIPSRTDAYLDALLSSMEVSEPGMLGYAVIADNGLSQEFKDRWKMMCTFEPTPQPFVFAQAINLAVAKIPKSADILILNDDTTMVSTFWRQRAERLLRSPDLERYGMISLAIDGGVGNPEQKRVFWQTPDVVEATKTLCFVAVIIRRTARHIFGTIARKRPIGSSMKTRGSTLISGEDLLGMKG